jgi:4'-phosphopantetheinyl transferase EntD
MGMPFSQPEREDVPASGCLAAVLEADSLARTGRDYSDLLSATERQWYGAFPTAKRRSEWLAGRLAAKYLFLNQLEMGEVDGDREWPPRLMPLAAQSLDDFPVSLFRAVELCPSSTVDGGPPRLRFGGKPYEIAVSLSHAGNNACACMSKWSTIGLDVEKVLPKVEVFYQSNFTISEKDWADVPAVSKELGRHWLYTLLWTIKEAALKARTVVHKSPWGFAGVGVGGLPPLRDLLSAGRTEAWGDYFGRFTARIDEECISTPVQVAFAATGDLIVTLVRRSPALAPGQVGRSYPS